jgi:hypothetical protein
MMNKIKDSLQASISTYVMMLFGMTIVFYMMGFTTMWTVWSNQSAASAQGSSAPIISNPNLFTSEFVIYGIIIAAFGTTVVAGIILKYTGGSAILGYTIPLIFLMVFLNIFIFPIWSLNDELLFAGSTLPIAGMLVAFFNLFLILSIIEFIRGGNT